MSLLDTIDRELLEPRSRTDGTGLRRFGMEVLFFGVKEARACLFAGLFFLSILVVPRHGLLGLPRYDVLLLVALAIQAWMIRRRIETRDEAKTILLFHLAGFALEVFKTSGANPSWSYPDFAYTKRIWANGVPGRFWRSCPSPSSPTSSG